MRDSHYDTDDLIEDASDAVGRVFEQKTDVTARSAGTDR